MYYEDIGVADLKLDLKNPRHDPVGGQREVINALLADGVDRDKLMKLAEDIAAKGLSPVDTLLVLQEPSSTSYTVVEGNRRVAAMKLLANPELAKEYPAIRERLKKVAKGAAVIPDQARCAVISTRDEGKHWQTLRHGGERGGVGVIPWSSEAAHRFAGQKGSHTDRGVAFADAVQRAYPKNQVLQDHLATVRKTRITTLGRLVSDPSARDRLGMEFLGGGVQSHYSAAALESAIAKILADLAGPVSVSELKTKQQRMQYLGKIQSLVPDPSEYQAEASPLSTGKPTQKPAKKKPKPSPAAPTPLYQGVQLTNLGTRVSSLLREIQRLNVDQFPNAAAALNRVLMELAIGQVHALNSWAEPKDLRAGVQYCLTKLDPAGKDAKYQPVRAGLADGTSMLAVKTMQAFMHNPYWNPTASEVRMIASNYSAFLTALDTLV